MDSQADSLDIAKLKCFALGCDENELSQAPTSEKAHSQTSPVPESRSPARTYCREPGAPCQVSPCSKHYVNGAAQPNPQSQELLSSIPNSTTPKPKMSSGDNGAGDTQPISQSIFDKIVSRAKSFQPSQEGEHLHSDVQGGDQESLQMTVREGEPGHIDLLNGFESKNSPIVRASTDDGLSSQQGPSSPVQLATHDVFPESQRFMETPVTSEKLRGMPDLAITTPSLPRNPLAADLGSSGSTLALSQLFRHTQAASSPFVNGNGLQLPPLSDRPSPDIPIQTRPLGAYMSSPSRIYQPHHLLPSHTEPLPYIPMDESQKLRDKLNEERQERTAEILDSEEHIDTDFDEESSYVQRLNRQRKIDNETSVCLAAVTHGRSLSDVKVGPPAKLANHQDREAPLVTQHDSSDPSTFSNNVGGSEEKTEKEENSEVPTSQTRRVASTCEDNKENCVEPVCTTSDATILAHDRLSQALAAPNDSSMADTTARPSSSTPDNKTARRSAQVINVRDSQPSPSQQSSKNGVPIPLSHLGSQQIRSSFDDSSPPRKRQRQRYIDESETLISPIGQHVQQISQLSSPLGHPSHISQPQASPKGQKSAVQKISGGPSSMPSAVSNTPLYRTGDDTIPETSIPESSPTRVRQATQVVEVSNCFPKMQEADQEESDLPPRPHLRQSGGFVRNSSHGATPQALNNRKPLTSRFVSSSPAKGIIKTLSELSAEPSPKGALDDENHYFIDILNEEDREFSNTVASPSRRTPRKKLLQADFLAGPLIRSSPLSVSQWSHVEAPPAVHLEPQNNDPESPERPVKPIAIRRQRGRLSRRSESIFDMEGSPRTRKSAPATSRILQITQHRRRERSISKVSNPERSGLGNSSQRSLSFDHIRIDSSQAEPMIPDTSVTSSKNLSNANIQNETVTSNIGSPAPENEIIAPNKVFALWNGRKRAFYPATFIRFCGPQRCLVKFNDSEPVEVDIGMVKRLQLRLGDEIKVDLPNVPKVTHVVVGVYHKLEREDLQKKDENDNYPCTDIHGFSTVVLKAKSNNTDGNDEPVQAPVNSIYLGMSLWNRMRDRAFTPDKKSELMHNIVLGSPSGGVSTPMSPGLKLSRSHLSIRAGLFSRMVFTITFSGQDATNSTKARITKLILENGGHILQDGFEELFEFPSSVPSVTPTGTLSQASNKEEAIQFRLAPEYEHMGFTCLITDQHSRRAKYMQALALNVPCVSRRWIEDCVSQNCVLSWEHYLLPAGESKYLHGAIKSRVLTPFPAETAMLSQMIDTRAKLLDGQSVLLAFRRTKGEERRKAYLFLAYALGAVRVGRVPDLISGQAMLHELAREIVGHHGWDWLYVDDEEADVTEKLTIGKPPSVSEGSRKRKRSSKSLGDGKPIDVHSIDSIQVMSNEFVCQSLILGKICK